MARTVVVHCDLCLEEGERTEAEELPPITIEGKRPRVLALCPEHKEEYYDPFVELVEDLAQEYPDDEDGADSEEEDGSDSEEEDWDDEPEDEWEESEESEDEPEEAEDGDEDEPSDEEDADDEGADAEEADDDPEQVVAESPAMSAVPDEPDTARWDCPVEDCDKSYTASGDNRADELKRLGNLHLATGHHLDKAARQELLSA